MATDPNARPLVLLPGVQWDPKTRTATGTPTQGWSQPPPQPQAAPNQARVAAALGVPAAPSQGGSSWDWAAALKPESWSWGPGSVPLNTPQTNRGFSDPLPNNKDATKHWSLDQIPQWNAPNSMRQALADQGWNLGSVESEPEAPTALVDMKNVNLLTEHSYDISQKDWSAIQRLNGQWVDDEKNPAPTIRQGYVTSAPMTDDAYAALSDDQRLAVDFNTLLVEAREEDLKSAATLQGAELDQYNADVKDIFGEGGESNVLAPNTVRMLKGLNFKAEGQDLDDFLSTEAAVSLNKLLKFELPKTPNMMIKPQGTQGTNQDLADFVFTRSDENRARATAVAIRNAAELIDKALKNQSIRQPNWMGTVQQSLGGKTPEVPLGWSSPDQRDTPELAQAEAWYQGAYDYLRNAQNADLTGFWSSVQEAKLNEKEIDDLFGYIDARSKWEIRTGAANPGGRSGAELRKFAGLEG